MAVPNDVVGGQLIEAADFNAVLDELRKGKEQRGTVTISVSASISGTGPVAFPQAFGTAPIVTLQVVGISTFIAWASGVTATGMAVGVRNYADASSTTDVVVHWTARLP